MGSRSTELTKWLFFILILILVFLTAIAGFSPYKSYPGFTHKLIQHSVEIETPVDTVFKFLGKSENASRWSVFVDHIIPLNSGKVSDGSVGSQRRCFCNKDETGKQWDELITVVIPGKKRQLTIYNLKEFPISAENLATEQIYKKLDDKKCRVTFTVFFNKSPGIIDEFKMYIAAYEINRIFSQNMQNIKRIVETSQSSTIYND
ncbi:SRPBCC family protein [Dyadobacter sp. NIV53]|uniref:SRPBCC family protein n=1 Tax=Dyadobacter sp. NIV53 TaxID=2861765 RepID=UPI001C888BD5|nr:SRPBCC family protein [Dyadobacter sp. NIV53]